MEDKFDDALEAHLARYGIPLPEAREADKPLINVGRQAGRVSPPCAEESAQDRAFRRPRRFA